MIHRHHTATGYDASEDHRAGASGEHRSSSRRCEVNAAMSRPIPDRWRVESPDHGRRARKWPAKPAPGFVVDAISSVHHSGQGCGWDGMRRPPGPVAQPQRRTAGNRDEPDDD
jgi:hypothetical protein